DKYSRPDISINNPNNLQHNTGRQPIQKVIIDVSFTCVLEGVQDGKIKSASNRNNAMKVGSKAHTRYEDKIRNYQRLIQALPRQASPRNYKTLPFVIQSTGLIHNSSLDLLERMAKSASNVKRIPSTNMFTYFKRRISCCLAKNLARIINSRGHRIISHSAFREDRSFDAN